jgi:hypothetical protein
LRIAISAVSILASVAAAQHQIHVSPGGDDARGDGTAASPLATPEGALAAARLWRQSRGGLDQDLHVILHTGVYELPRTITIDGTLDGGTTEHAVVIAAAPDERVVLSGGVRVTGWTLEGGRLLWGATADSELPLPTDLYVNGRRLTRARFPNSGWLPIENAGDDQSFELARGRWFPGRRSTATDPTPEAVARKKFVSPRAELAWWRDARFVTRGRFGADLANIRLQRGDEVYFEGARDFLDAEGEWHFTPASGGQSPRFEVISQAAPSAEGEGAVVPRLQTLLVLDRAVNTHVRGITLAYTTRRPPAAGYDSVWSGFGANQEEWGRSLLPAAVRLVGTSGCTLEGVTVAHTGGNGIWIESHQERRGVWTPARDNTLRRCRVVDLGGTAIGIGPTNRPEMTEYVPGRGPAGDADWVFSTTVLDCVISGFGQVYHDTAGIVARFSDAAVIEGNDVGNGAYSGIALGWSHVNSQRFMHANRVARNRVHGVMRSMADGAAIYATGAQPDSIMEGNVVDAVLRDQTFTTNRLPVAGLYFDEGSVGWTIRDNVIRDTPVPIVFNISGSRNHPDTSKTSGEQQAWGRNFLDSRYAAPRLFGGQTIPQGAIDYFDPTASHGEVDRLEAAAGPRPAGG